MNSTKEEQNISEAQLGASLIRVGKSHFAIVDSCDLAWISRFSWKLDKHGYAKRVVRKSGKETVFWMHREINQTPKHLQTDHINGVRLDNRRSNLRSATNAQNSHNSKLRVTNKCGFKGVFWLEDKKRFVAQIRAFGKCYRLGSFRTAQEASVAYQEAGRRLHGEFARN